MTREEIIEQLDGIIGTYEILIGNGVNSDILNVDDIEAIREAISVLSAEPCEDCISRNAVLKIAQTSKSNWIDNSVLYSKVKALPSVQPKAKWIPVKEDLPKTADSVLISINGKIGKINHEHSIMFGSYCSVDGWMIEDVKVDYNKDYFEVEAWQKAPEIYDGREGEE